MKIFNKFIWSKKEPSNKNDIWFDGSTWRMYTEEAWQSFTLPVDAADKVAKVLENASEVYQEKLNAGYGIIIEGNTISLDDSDVWEAIETLQQNKVEQIQLNDYVPLDRYISTSQVLMDNISELNSIKLNKTDVATINGQSLAEGGNIVIEENSKIILDFEKLGEPIESDEDSMEMRYSKEQFENAVGMSMSEFIEKIKTSELVLSYGVSGINSYYVVADEYTWTGYYKIPRLFNYVLSVDATPSEEKMFVSVYDEAADLPFARTEYVDEKHAQTETKLAELSEENERLKERIEEQDQFIEVLQNTKIDRENDDYYPMMAVGLADNLAGVDVVDSEINFRRSGGGAISDGVARIESIKGNSVVWNQQNNPYLTEYVQKWLALNGNSYSITAEVDKSEWFAISKPKEWREGHYYYFALNVTGTPTSGLYMNAADKTVKPNTPLIVQISAAPTSAPALRLEAGNVGVTFSFQAIDLTQMFNSGNEPTTIEEFNARKPLNIDEYAYNEGEVIHMDVQSIESVGVNQWDEEWEQGGIASASGLPITLAGAIRSKNFSPIFPSTSYYVNWAAYTGDKYIFFYDREQNFISKSSFASNGAVNTPSNAAYFKIRIDQGSSFHKDICINRYDTAINGQYFPYIKRVEDLSIIRKYFPQGMKSAGSAHDEIRYNKASGKWEKVVKISSVDLGTLKWYMSSETYPRFFAKLNGALNPSASNLYANILCAKYVNWTAGHTYNGVVGIALDNQGYLRVYDPTYTDAESFKAAMPGVMLYYELAEPIVTELDEADQFKDLDYQVWNCGTEKAIAEGKSAPLAADITYGFNAIGKIKEIESKVAALVAKVGDS